MNKKILILLSLLAFYVLCNMMNRIDNPIVKDLNEVNPIKSYKVFTYIELPDNYNKEKKIQLLSKEDSIPIFYKLCIELMKRKIDGIQTDLIILTPDNYSNYVDDFPICMKADSEYPLKFRVDLLAAYVLDKNGGLFLSPGTIVYNNILSVLMNVNTFDLVTFGSSVLTPSCKNRNYPGSFILGSKYKSDFIKLYKQKMLEVVVYDNNPSESKGEEIMSEILLNKKYDQYHYCCEHDGSKDILNNHITVKDYLGKQDIRYKNPNNLTLISFPYHISLKDSENYWFNNLSQEQFFESDMYVSKLFRKLFKI